MVEPGPHAIADTGRFPGPTGVLFRAAPVQITRTPLELSSSLAGARPRGISSRRSGLRRRKMGFASTLLFLPAAVNGHRLLFRQGAATVPRLRGSGTGWPVIIPRESTSQPQKGLKRRGARGGESAD